MERWIEPWMERNIMLGNGVEIRINDKKIFLDPRRVEANALSFVSHAHLDHVPRKFSRTHDAHHTQGALMLSRETESLVKMNEKEKEDVDDMDIDDIGMSCFFSDELELRLHNAGHILGSSQLAIQNSLKIVYTGDLNLKGGFTVEKADVIQCDVLIIEATFGMPYYEFPEKEETAKEIKDWAEECFSKGKKPALLAYALGKSQELIKGLSEKTNIAASRRICELCEAYRELGAYLGEYARTEETKENEDYLFIFPPSFSKQVESRNYEKAIASGWAVHEETKFRYGASRGFVFSDHSDFYSLLEYVEKASPQVVYTLHGYAGEFAQELRKRGFYAEPLVKNS